MVWGSSASPSATVDDVRKELGSRVAAVHRDSSVQHLRHHIPPRLRPTPHNFLGWPVQVQKQMYTADLTKWVTVEFASESVVLGCLASGDHDCGFWGIDAYEGVLWRSAG
jgi:hypothetical protein